MKFKVGDKVKVVKACQCQYWNESFINSDCRNNYYNKVAIIESINNRNYYARVDEIHFCHFTEEQLELVEKAEIKLKEIKQYPIVKFLQTLEKEK